MLYPRKYPTTDGTALAPLDWNKMVDLYNGFTPEGYFVSPYSFVIFSNQVGDPLVTYYYACDAFQIRFGGPTNEPGGTVDGTDAAAVIHAARDDLPNGGEIRLKGHIKISTSFIHKSKVTLSGEGSGTVIEATGDFPVIIMDGTNEATVKDMTLKGGGKSNTAAHGIKYIHRQGCRRNVINNLWIHSCRHGIDLYGSLELIVRDVNICGLDNDQNYIGVYTHVPLVGTDTDGSWARVGVLETHSHGWRLEHTSGMQLVNCGCGAIGGKGFYIGAPATPTVVHWLHVTGCLADSCADDNWFFDATGTLDGYVSCMQFDNIWSGNSMQVESSGIGFRGKGLVNSTISNILFSRFDNDAIKLENGFRVEINGGFIEIWGEYQEPNTYCGVRLVNMLHSGVQSVNFVSEASLAAIREEGTSDHNRFIGNDVSDGGGITVLGASTISELNV